MAYIGGASTLASHSFGLSPLGRAATARFDRTAAAFGELELERTGERIGLCQPQLEPVARRIACAAALADQRLCSLFVPKTFAPQRRNRKQPVAAQPHDCGEEPEALHPGDTGIENLAYEV